MTTTYDPRNRTYTDEHDLRLEVARVFDICTSCQKCVSLCPTFPALFSVVQSKPDVDAGRLTPDEQDSVINECFRCMACSTSCPYMPGLHTDEVDFPRLVDRYRAMQKAQKKWPLRSSIGHVILGRSTSMVRFIVRRHPNGLLRRMLAWAIGVSRIELRRDQSQVELSSWVASRARTSTTSESRVAVFPTCVVEAVTPQIAQQVIEEYDRSGIECSLVGEKMCCGAPALLHGDAKYFRKNAMRVIEVLTGVIRNGAEIVVADPRCRDVIVRDYPHYVETKESRLLAAHVSVAQGVGAANGAGSHAWWGLHREHPFQAMDEGPDFAKKSSKD